MSGTQIIAALDMLSCLPSSVDSKIPSVHAGTTTYTGKGASRATNSPTPTTDSQQSRTSKKSASTSSSSGTRKKEHLHRSSVPTSLYSSPYRRSVPLDQELLRLPGRNQCRKWEEASVSKKCLGHFQSQPDFERQQRYFRGVESCGQV